MSYIIRKIHEEDIALHSREWENANAARVSYVNWAEYPYAPQTTAFLMYNNRGIYIKFITDEHPAMATLTNLNDDVYTESCVEFFVRTNIKNPNYINFEINAIGTPLIGCGPGRDRKRLTADIEQFEIEAQINNGGWALKFFIPFSFLSDTLGGTDKVMLGNLQKCAEITKKPHFLSYYSIKSEHPDFHRPECFGEFILE